MYSFLPQHNTKQFKNISSSDWDLVSISGQQLHSWINEVTCTVGSEKKETRRYVLTHNHMDQHQHLKVMTSDKTLQLRIPTVQIPSSALFVNIAEPAFKSPSFDKKYHVWFFVFFSKEKNLVLQLNLKATALNHFPLKSLPQPQSTSFPSRVFLPVLRGLFVDVTLKPRSNLWQAGAAVIAQWVRTLARLCQFKPVPDSF